MVLLGKLRPGGGSPCQAASLSDSSEADSPRISILGLRGPRNRVQFTVAQMGKLRPRGQASRHHRPSVGPCPTHRPPPVLARQPPVPQFLAPLYPGGGSRGGSLWPRRLVSFPAWPLTAGWPLCHPWVSGGRADVRLCPQCGRRTSPSFRPDPLEGPPPRGSPAWGVEELWSRCHSHPWRRSGARTAQRRRGPGDPFPFMRQHCAARAPAPRDLTAALGVCPGAPALLCKAPVSGHWPATASRVGTSP